MKQKSDNSAKNANRGLNLTSRNRFNERIFMKILGDETLCAKTGLLYDAYKIVASQSGKNWLPLAPDIFERVEEESDEDFKKRVALLKSSTVVNRVVMPMDSSKTANTLYAMAVKDSRDRMGRYEFPSVGRKISIEEEISDKLEERIDRSIFLDVEDMSNGMSYRVPFNLITIGGAGGLGKTGIDIKLTSIVALANIMDTLDIARQLISGELAVDDVPLYFMHRIGRVMDIANGIEAHTGTDVSKMDSLLLFLLAQSSYVHLEEPSKDAENIAIPRSKGKKILTPLMSSSLAGSTIDSLTSVFFAVSGGAMQGGWNPSEAKALLSKLDKFSSRFSHPIISVINYLKFNADGQKGIASICQSMSSMHIDLGSKRILLRTETDKRPPVSGNLLIKGITIRTVDRDAVDFNIISDYAEKQADGVHYVQLDLIHDKLESRLSQIAGCNIILHDSITIDSPDKKYADIVEHPLVLVLDHKKSQGLSNGVEDVIKHIDVGNQSIHSNADEDNRVIHPIVSSVVTRSNIGDSRTTPFLSSLYLKGNDRGVTDVQDGINEDTDNVPMSKSEKAATVGIVKWSILSDKQLIMRAAAVADLASLNEYGNEEINKAKLIYKECMEEYLDRGYTISDFEQSVIALKSNSV